MTHIPRSSRLLTAAALGALFLLGARQAAGRRATGPSSRPPVTLLPGTDIRLLPETERTMERIVLGLDANQTRYEMLPETVQWDPKTQDPRVRYLRRHLYWLNFELAHGGILKAAPDYTRFFMAVPDAASVRGSLGNEEAVFREYLRNRIGWSDDVIARRVRFFRTPVAVPFPRDMAEPLGRDARERLALAMGADSDSHYAEPVRRLVASYPEEFVLKIVPEVNTEGGDLSLVALPEGGLGLIVGYHRILRYLEVTGRPPNGTPVSVAQIREGRDAFRKAFFGVEILILGEQVLREPATASAELIHADMVVNVMRGQNGLVAFIPSYREGQVIDAISQAELPEDARRRAQTEYDGAARLMQKRGYRVVRLPFRDHPDRTPVQVGGFVDLRSGRPSILLGKYPYHLDLPGGHNPQRELQASLGRLEDAVAVWRHEPSEARWQAVVESIAGVWKEMDLVSESSNPSFQLQARMYEAEGIRVIPVPIYPTGEGGLHCLLLN